MWSMFNTAPSQILRSHHQPALTTFLEHPEAIPMEGGSARHEQRHGAADLDLRGTQRHQCNMLHLVAPYTGDDWLDGLTKLALIEDPWRVDSRGSRRIRHHWLDLGIVRDQGHHVIQILTAIGPHQGFKGLGHRLLVRPLRRHAILGSRSLRAHDATDEAYAEQRERSERQTGACDVHGALPPVELRSVNCRNFLR